MSKESKLEQAAAKYANEYSEGEGYADYHDRKMGFIAGANWQSLTTPVSNEVEREGRVYIDDIYPIVKQIRNKEISIGRACELINDLLPKSGEGDAVDGWISVDSAPKDGTHILGYDPNTREIYVVWWNQYMGNGCWNSQSNNYIPKISHYKLLPKPPIK